MIRALIIVALAFVGFGCSTAPPTQHNKSVVADPSPPNEGLAAHADTVFTLLAVDAAVAQALLPPDLELMPQTLTPAGQHPVIIQRQRVTGEHAVGSADAPFDYDEIIFGIPLTQLRGGRTCQGANGPFVYWPILAVTDQRAIDLGNYYGFPKILATIDDTNDRFDVTLNGLPLLYSTNGAREPINAIGAANIQLLLPVVGAPLISRRPSGELIWSSVTLTSTPAWSALTVDMTVLGGQSVHSPSLNESPLGSIEVVYDSLLSPPVVCPGQ